MIERPVRLEHADFVVLGNRWQDTCSKFGLKDSPKFGELSVFENITRTYVSRDGYHNLDHLAFMFNLLDQYRDRLKNPEVVDFAVFFHDYKYEPTSRTNEEDSARDATMMLAQIGAGPIVTSHVSRLIMASKDHKLLPGSRADVAYFMDADMAILGSDAESYLKYAAGVARDYKTIEASAYVNGRKEFLGKIAKRRLFSTNEMHLRFNALAKENIRNEIDQLEKISQKLS